MARRRYRHIGLQITTIVEITDPRGRTKRYRGHNTVTDYGLFLAMQVLFGAIQAPSMPGASATLTLARVGGATRYNDGTNVYPSLHDLGANNGAATNPWDSASGIQTSGTLITAATNGLFGGGSGLLLVATSDSSAPSETQFAWPTGTQAIWSSTSSTASTSPSNDQWTLTGSTNGATPPQAKFVIADSTVAANAVTIQSMGWTAAFTLGSVSGATAPTAQAAPTTAWTSTTPTVIAGWPIFSKVIPSGAPISVAAGSTIAATYIFTLTT
jgi:hypothetical protein